MKIGKFNFKEYAAKKPLLITPDGKFLSAREVVSQPTLGAASAFSLNNEDRIKLALERYRLEPDFKLMIFGKGLVTKSQLMTAIKKQDELGMMALDAEMGYCSELLSNLAGGIITPWPKEPRIPIPKKPDWKIVKKCIQFKLKTRALFCENTTDSVTTPFANYRMKYVHPVFVKRGFSITVLKGVDDIRANFIAPAKNPLTVYISGIGHGSYTCFTGHWGNHILEVGQYDPAEVKGKAIHFLSCQTAKTLGPDTVAKGAKCYAGYIENFVLQWDDPSTPAVNEFNLFARSDSTFDIMMAMGATAKQAFAATIQAFNAAISQVPNMVAATYLALDRDRLKLHGNAATQILPYRYFRICFPILRLETEEAFAKISQPID
jgi:hypothetical protein